MPETLRQAPTGRKIFRRISCGGQEKGQVIPSVKLESERLSWSPDRCIDPVQVLAWALIQSIFAVRIVCIRLASTELVGSYPLCSKVKLEKRGTSCDRGKTKDGQERILHDGQISK